MKRIYVIIDPLITDEHSWELHLSSLLHGYVESMNLDYEVKQVQDLSLIKESFQQGYITNEDLFIFPNAWTSMTTYVKHWSENYDTPVKMIGFWSRGCYVNQDDEFRPMNDRNWRKVHERASFRCLDKSYFISEFHKEQFRIYVSKFVFPERLNVLKFPLDYLQHELAEFKDMHYKTPMVLFPWHKYTDVHEQIMYDFIRVFNDVQIIFAQERVPLERHQLLTQLSKAKIAFLPYEFPTIGKEIYECFLLGTIPLVPDIEGLRELVPAAFRYPKEWTAGIFNYSKFAPDLTKMMRHLIDEYDSYVPLIEQQQNTLFNNFYDSQKIIEEVFGNINNF